MEKKGKRVLEYTVFDGTEETLPKYDGVYLIQQNTKHPFCTLGEVRLVPAHYHTKSRVFFMWHPNVKEDEDFPLEWVRALVAGDRWCEIPRSFDEDTAEEGDK